MRHYVWIDAGGDQCFGATDGDLPKGATEVPRAPGPFERWDFDAGDYLYDAEGHADWQAGPAHIAAMHQRKTVEALLIAGGIVLPEMVLFDEAAARAARGADGATPAELAAIVLEKAAAAVAIELDRQAASLTKSDRSK